MRCSVSLSICAGAVLLLAACASTPPAAPAAGGAAPPPANLRNAMPPAAAASAPPVAPVPPPGTPPPFASVIKDARRIEGPITAWQKDDKVWLELAPADFGKAFLLSPKIKTGIGEAWVLGGLYASPVSGAGGPQIVEFVKVNNQVRLQARNTDILARPGTPEARAVETSYSASLLGSVAVVSQPQPERKSVLIEANGLFLTDLLGVGMMLQRAFRQGYALDPRNSSISAVRGTPEALAIETQNHYYTGSIAVLQPGAPPGVPAPSVPSFVPDTRSLFVGHHFSLALLPAEPMARRRADPRVGLFSSTQWDFSDDLARTPRQRTVSRWRLEKKDPAAALSEPVKPITYWIDRNVPLLYRDTVRAAILEWNKAFEAIGFKDAIVVKQQPDDAEWDTLDFGHGSVRWMANAGASFVAVGPSHVDPRSGEIMDASIGFESLWARQARTIHSQFLEQSLGGNGVPGAAADPAAPQAPQAYCQYGALAGEQALYAMDVLAARGDLDPDSPETQQFVLDFLKDTIMHEVGHTLGLRHNFRASRVYTDAQLSDLEFTRAHGTAGSVMDYAAVNLARTGERAGTPFQRVLGPYDYWAIEYAYKPLPPAGEAAGLQQIAARSNEPLLAYGSDEDAAYGIDPETLLWDLGSDAVSFAARRLDIARDLFKRQETRTLPADSDYSVLRRSLTYALGDVSLAVNALTRQIGGVRTLRDFPGSGRDPLEPVPAAAQRRALDLISGAVLSVHGLSVTPELQRRLAPDFLDRADIPGLPTVYDVPQRLLDLQRLVLNLLMSDAVAARLLDNVGKLSAPAQAFTLAELYSRLTNDIWSELAAGGSISGPRRELQREHALRLAVGVWRPGSAMRADARGLMRQQAQKLLARIEAAKRSHPHGADALTQAHLAESADILRQALAAPLLRPGL